jgi:pimeloyl-ACP methyl ester carboxylesterase
VNIKKDSLTGICYEVIGDVGSKNTLLFLHGAGGNMGALKALASQFSEYKCILIDLPGHNLSSGNTAQYVSDYAIELEKFIQSCKDEFGDNITCIGHSMGGMISLELAIRKVADIKKLVILNSGARLYIDDKFMKKVNKGKIDKLYLFKAGGSYFKLRTYQFFFKNFKQMISSIKVMCEDMKTASKFDRRDAVKEIKLPTFIATGEKEILATVKDSEFLHTQIHGSKLLIMKKMAHLMPIIVPEKLAHKIKKFLEM